MNRENNLRRRIADGARKLGIELSELQMNQFFLFMNELLTWNKRINLTAITDEEDVITKHFLDSLSVYPYLPGESSTLLDVGTGAGFPGIPLKIVCPDLDVYLLDSVRKKADFLNHSCALLNLSCTVLNIRAEDGARNSSYREMFDIVVSRAVADLPLLSEYCLPYVAIGGSFIALKSTSVLDELERSLKAIQLLGGGKPAIVKLVVPGTDILREGVIVKKHSPTPQKFPRKAGIPAKRPII